MNEVLEDLIEWMELIENSITMDEECPSEFEKEFCDGNECLGYWLSSNYMLVKFILSNGNLVYSEYPMLELSNWLDKW